MKTVKLLALSLCVMSLSGCITRSQIQANLWMHNGLPDELCVKADEYQAQGIGWDYGFYRKLNDGNYEFISFCDPKSKEWFAMHKDDLAKVLDSLPKRK